jgi:hypothetical protein
MRWDERLKSTQCPFLALAALIVVLVAVAFVAVSGVSIHDKIRVYF